MKTFFDQVGEFHEKFRLPMKDVAPCELMTTANETYRINFLEEELEEFKLACREENLPAMLDALVDLAWVAMGTAHYLGAPFNEAWDAVYRANMQKVRTQRGSDDHKRGEAEPIRKPIGWEPPDIAGVIARYNDLVKRMQDHNAQHGS